jgi:hypothetical protein
MAEQESSKGLDAALDNLKDLSPKSKEYSKFVIGLATGTLVFSVTFLKGLVIFPEYKFILIIGWFCLLASIIAGVLLLPKTDELHAYIQSLKNLLKSPETIVPIVKKELQEHFLKSWTKNIIDPVVKDDENKKKELYQFVDNLSLQESKKYLEALHLLNVKDPQIISFLKEFLEGMFKLLSLSKMVELRANPSFVLKSIKKIILQRIWFDRLMKYAFFVGILAISVFSIINFLR